jgi:lipoprotein-anchoring transpeptidase ErfK/SrfK
MLRAAVLALSTLLCAPLGALAQSPIELLMLQRQKAEAAAAAAIAEPVVTHAIAVPTAKPVAKRSVPRRRADDKLIAAVPKHLAAYTVPFFSDHAPGTLVIDTSRRALYRVLNGREALRYGVAVGREGFEWTGTEIISARTKWPDWRPPPEMRLRDPSLPEFMPGGPRNPLGARALYLGRTLYRIHGTWSAKDIGRNASSGCIRMLNAQVAELYSLVKPGETRVVVASHLPRAMFGEGRGDSRVSEQDRIPMMVPSAFDALAVDPSHPFGRR